MGISFQGIGQQAASFFANKVMDAGSVCKVSSNNGVTTCVAGENFCGVAGNTRAGVVHVTLKGYVTVPYTGTAPKVGWCALAANGNGGVKTLEGAREYLVTDVNVTESTVGFFL